MTGLYSLALNQLKELYKNDKSSIIRFPKLFEKLCATFFITKEQAWELLFIFHEFGFIEIVPFQGIRIKE